jgi:hypothetical protein
MTRFPFKQRKKREFSVEKLIKANKTKRKRFKKRKLSNFERGENEVIKRRCNSLLNKRPTLKTFLSLSFLIILELFLFKLKRSCKIESKRAKLDDAFLIQTIREKTSKVEKTQHL